MKKRRFCRRRMEERFFQVLMVLATAVVVGVPMLLLAVVLAKGAPSLSLEMLTQTPQGGFYLGGGGGILNAIVGSAIIGVAATVLALLLSFPIALYLNVYADPSGTFARWVRFAMDALWSVPSIVYGAVGFAILTAMGCRACLGAAIGTVAALELPILVRGLDEALQTVPDEIGEASYMLGATRLETGFRVIARQAAPALAGAVLIAFGRAVGDTASVLWTAGFTDGLPISPAEPAATLPLSIFFQLGSPFPEVRSRAYAAAAVLTVLVLTISIVSQSILRRQARHVVR